MCFVNGQQGKQDCSGCQMEKGIWMWRKGKFISIVEVQAQLMRALWVTKRAEMLQNKSFALLHVGLLGNFKEFYEAGIRYIFTCRMTLREWFFLPEKEGLGLTQGISVICSVCSCPLCSCPQHWGVQGVALLPWQLFGHESFVRLQGCRP